MTRAETAVEIHDLIAERRSPRSLDGTAEISDRRFTRNP
jgi:hypothetical protein